MGSLFNKGDVDNIISRINSLTPQSKPLWGKMTASQMIAHLQKPLEVAIGELQLKRTFLSFLFGRLAKNKMIRQAEFSKNLPTDPSFVVKIDPNFHIEKEKIIRLIRKLSDEGPSALSKLPHPFFGKLSEEEWDILGWKHLDHHLRQFGV